MTRLLVLLSILALATPGDHTCRWTFQGGTPASSDSCSPPAVTFGSTGPKTVTLTVCAGGRCSTVTESVQVLDPRPRIVKLLPPSGSLFPGDPVAVSAQVSGQPPLTLLWTFPGGTSSSNPLTFPAPKATQAAVSLTASNPAGSSSLRITIPIQEPRPRPSIALPPPPFYVGATLVARANVSGRPPFAYQWSLAPEGLTSTSSTFTWSTTAAAPGLRRLELRVSNAEGSKTVSRSFSLSPIPLVTSFRPLCSDLCFFPYGSPVPFETLTSASVDRLDYDWNGDGHYEQSSRTPIPLYTFPIPGSFRPRVRALLGRRSEIVYSSRIVYVPRPK